MHRRGNRFVRVARFWESEIEHLVGVGLPDYLHPKSWNRTGGWAPGEQLSPWYTAPTYLSQALVTVFFGLLVILALLSKVI